MFDFIDDFQGDNAIYPQNGFYIPEATDCMRCGMCLSTCPTNKLFKTEAETPRNRLRTIDKIINGDMAVSSEELVIIQTPLTKGSPGTENPARL
jgi:glycolate oxidase iron-sulfur subunit